MSNQSYQSESRGGGGGGSGGSGGSGGRRFYSHPRVCMFCTDHSVVMDYKNTDLLRRFISEDGKIRPRRQTGTCAKHQRDVAQAVKRARHLALIQYTGESLR